VRVTPGGGPHRRFPRVIFLSLSRDPVLAPRTYRFPLFTHTRPPTWLARDMARAVFYNLSFDARVTIAGALDMYRTKPGPSTRQAPPRPQTLSRRGWTAYMFNSQVRADLRERTTVACRSA